MDIIVVIENMTIKELVSGKFEETNRNILKFPFLPLLRIIFIFMQYVFLIKTSIKSKIL